MLEPYHAWTAAIGTIIILRKSTRMYLKLIVIHTKLKKKMKEEREEKQKKKGIETESHDYWHNNTQSLVASSPAIYFRNFEIRIEIIYNLPFLPFYIRIS